MRFKSKIIFKYLKGNWEFLLLIFIFLLAVILRIKNWSNFHLYPDTYKYLLAAKGGGGWQKVSFTGLIYLFNLVFKNPELSGHLVSFFAGLAAIPLVYFVLKKFISSRAGLFGALLLAVSFSHVVFSGFILPDTTAICFYLIALLFVDNPFFSGLFILVSALAREEYILLFLPTLILIWFRSKEKRKIVSFLVWLAPIFFLLFFDQSYRQTLALGLHFKGGLTFFVADFALINFAVVLFGVTGIFTFIFNKKYKPYIIFSIVYAAILLLVYLTQNPANWRYNIHLILPLTIPAVLLLDSAICRFRPGRTLGYIIPVLAISLLIGQTILSLNGLSNLPNQSYETISALRVKQMVLENHLQPNRVLASFAEAYQYYLGLPAEKINSSTQISGHELLIVDQPMRDLEGENLQKLKQNYKLRKINEFYVGEPYYNSSKIMPERGPVEIYIGEGK
jgi:hypothetical protein